MVDEKVVKGVKRYLRALREQGLDIRFGVVFGSQATGKADAWSDIDLLIVSPRFDGMRSRRDIDLLWRTTAHTDNRIEPVPCGEKQWLEDDASAIVEIARREGEEIKI
jgi:uncharacterized protein